MQEGSEKIT